jgi:hypothetical protein
MPTAHCLSIAVVARSKRFIVMLLLAGTAVLAATSPLPAAGVKSLDRIETNLLSREVKERSRNFVASSAALEQLLDEFSHFVRLSDRSELRAAIRALEQIEGLHRRLQADAGALSDYLAQNRKRIRQEGLGQLLALQDLTDKGFRHFDEAFVDYLAARSELLHWSEEHFLEITAGDEAARRRYDKLYKRCEKSMDKEYDRYLERIQFVNAFLQDHPELADYVAR